MKLYLVGFELFNLNKMKKIIVLFCICYVCCNFTSCNKEKDTSKCENHKIEISDYSCFKFKRALDIKDPYYCSIYPEKAEEQKLFWRLINGLSKELLSSTKGMNLDPTFTIAEKSFYKKGEVVTLKNTTLTTEEKKIINDRNTCIYQFYGRYMDNYKEYPEGYPNVTDPNLCFNVDSINDLKGILNCGLANITYTINNKTKKITTCFYSVGNKAFKELQQIFPKIYFQDLFGIEGFSGFNALLYTLDAITSLKNYEKNLKLNQNLLIKRKLENNEIQNYEIIIEDKNGKVTKYNKGSESIQVIKAGNSVDDDDYEDFDIFGDNSSFLKFNIFISLLLIILNL